MLLHLSLPTYLAQWYAHECRREAIPDADSYTPVPYHYPDPVLPIRGSAESAILALYLTKQPDNPAPPSPDATIALLLPSFRNRDTRIYSYLPPAAVILLADTIRTRFQIALWRDIHTLNTAFTRKDLALSAWMELHAIEFNDTNYNSVLKIYDRTRDAYRHSLNRRKKK